MSETYDIFLSHASADNPHVRPLVDALKRAGLRIWFDEIDIEDFTSISESISDGLANSKAFLAYYSVSYPGRRACQWELTAALLAAEREHEVRRRILLVNPESSFAHIVPVELRDERLKILSRHSGAAVIDAVAGSIRSHVLHLVGSLGEVQTFEPPRWYGTKGTGSIRFVGRLRELWDIHSKLHANDFALITGAAAAGIGVAQVTGLGGIGKSLLAEEYALRFGMAYPGGVFWLRAYGNDDAKGRMGAADRSFERERQLRDFAEALDLSVEGRSPPEIEGALASKIAQTGQACLWVVDDLPADLDSQELREWLAPHALAKTLITTRSREYQALAHLDLGVLTHEDAYELLTFRRQPQGESELKEAHSLISDLGCHALAVDVAGAGLAVLRDIQTFADFRRRLQRDDKDVLELSAALADVLPNGHERSIAATLLHSIRSLSAGGRDFLRVASVLAVAPIRPRLVVDIFELADRLKTDEASEFTARALQDVEKLSLLERISGEDGLCKVHTLVTRALRADDVSRLWKAVHRWKTNKRTRVLRLAAVQVLSTELDPEERTPIISNATLCDIPHAREVGSRITDLPEPDLLRCVAEYDYERGAYSSAASLDERAYEIYRRLYGPEDESTLIALNALLRDLTARGDERACAMVEEALDMELRLLGKDHAITSSLLKTFASLLELTGDVEDCESLQEMLVEADRTRLGGDHLSTLNAMCNQAVTKWRLGKTKEAAEILQRLLAIAVPTFGENTLLVFRAQCTFGQVLATLGEFHQARDVLAQTLQRGLKVFGLEHPQTSVAAYQLYAVLLKLDQREEARRVQDQYLYWLSERNPEELDFYQKAIRQALLDGKDITLTLRQPDSETLARSSDESQSKVVPKDAAANQKQDHPSLEVRHTAGIREYVNPLRAWQLLFLLCHRPDDAFAKLLRFSKLSLALVAVMMLLSTMPLVAIATFQLDLKKPAAGVYFWVASLGYCSVLGLFAGLFLGRGFHRKVMACLPFVVGFSLAFGLIFNKVDSVLMNTAIAMVGQCALGFAFSAGLVVADRSVFPRLNRFFAFFGPFWAILFGLLFALGKIRVGKIPGGPLIGVLAGLLTLIPCMVGFFRLYYLPIHLSLIWPHVRAAYYKWHPISWDHLCLTPLPGLESLLVAYSIYDKSAGEAEINRLIYKHSGQAASALRARVASLT